jgi:CRISPR-associated endonuclease Cas1
VQNGALTAQNGFTHYPQERETRRLFPGDRTLPTRIVLLDANGSLSFDVLSWLSAQKIPLVQIDWQGNVVTLSAERMTDSKIYQAQLAARTNGVGFTLAKCIVRDKILASIETIHTLDETPERARGFAQLNRAISDLDRHPPTELDKLRLLEGRAALAYFRALQTVPIRWKGTGRKPIPETWRKVALRKSSTNARNRHATHPFNAILNYAYGVLESQTRIDTVAAGLDPTIGYLHAETQGRIALVYDLMEPQRPAIDREMLKFIAENDLSPGDIVVAPNGVCRLHPQLARAVTVAALRACKAQDPAPIASKLRGAPPPKKSSNVSMARDTKRRA